ncbi:hypothetical protein EDC18_10939 [Natranaerovirga pectinivora]|uniref:Universal stress protein family protein n=1 Tax=Natranaerovirga pectinivora TaxID=682400 RepID=A0A4R3MM67_9FIRM|nr:hypothetical protein [Natranaerovirga pectinivora]TCT13076.1 hypothetical protein EDC18_10939 [Natranaerovirga pectinivora]
MKKKVLVCITIQENSLRLIKEGSSLASSQDAEFHILHVEKGMSIFDQEGSVSVLEKLFELGKELGGEIHFISDQDVVGRIVKMTRDLEITHLIIGQTMENKVKRLLKKDMNNRLVTSLDNIEIVVMDRYNN